MFKETEPQEEPKAKAKAKAYDTDKKHDFNAAVKEHGCTASKKDDDGDIVISKGDKEVLKVQEKDGYFTFVTLMDTDLHPAGTVLQPSDQKKVAEHAACCARDMTKE